MSLQSNSLKLTSLESYQNRREALCRLLTWLTLHEADILTALQADLAKSQFEAYISEVYFLKQELRFALKHLKQWMKPTSVSGVFFTWPSSSKVYRKPMGASLIVSPWNYPFQLALSPLIASIAGGNITTLSVSESAEATFKVLQLCIEACFDPSMVSIVGASHLERLLEQKWDVIFYTGNTEKGKQVMAKAALNLTPVILELGGKSPCVVDKYQNAERVCRKIIRGKLFNAGQTCIAPDFMCIPKDELETYTQTLIKVIQSFYGDDPCSSKDYGRIIHQGHYQRLQNLLQGHPNVLRIGKDAIDENKFAPTLMPDASWDSRVMKEEIFGPILPLITYENHDDLLEKLNVLSTPLSVYVFSDQHAFVSKTLHGVPSGNACVNDTMLQIANPRLPFGGKGPSGMGRYHGKSGFDVFTYEYSVMKKSLRFSPFEVNPPYERAWEKFRKYLT